MDRLFTQSACFTNAVSGLPVFSPMRATKLTGQRPLTHGVFINDVPLNPDAVTIGKVLGKAGYDTGFVGKWHIDGRGRSIWIPREQRQGFDYLEGARMHTHLKCFYAHCSALDDCIGQLMQALQETRQADNTILMFTADHGDMLGSQGMQRKQRPWDESIRVPKMIRWPKGEIKPGKLAAPMNMEDNMPTLLALNGIAIPSSVEGLDYGKYLCGGADPGDDATVIQCASPFGEWTRKMGGREYRGVRTARYTFVRDLNGPWLLYDNETDPYQMNNLVNKPESADLQAKMVALLAKKLKERGDEFKPGADYLAKWNYKVDADGTMPYKN